MIDLYAIYRKVPPADRRPFNRFFESAGFGRAYDHLRAAPLPESSIIKRSRGSVAAPATAFVHPLVALEFVRWVNYDSFVALSDLTRFTSQSDLTAAVIGNEHEQEVASANEHE
jgi:hypothetical protein